MRCRHLRTMTGSYKDGLTFSSLLSDLSKNSLSIPGIPRGPGGGQRSERGRGVRGGQGVPMYRSGGVFTYPGGVKRARWGRVTFPQVPGLL